jgi:hypothetical protein|tara:strand:- start:1848 stop:2321 length:474 start_codon:yes stop_codon:yes gene_type:complete
MKIIDNFLSDNNFKKIQELFMSPDFPYYFNSTVADETDTNNFYFTHTIYDKNIVNSDYYKTLDPLLTKLDTMFLRRVKVNCYTRSEKIIKHKAHKDYEISHKGAILSLNTCNGGTYVGKKFIKSVANRILLFDPSVFHSSTNCTDQQARFNININWK